MQRQSGVAIKSTLTLGVLFDFIIIFCIAHPSTNAQDK